jgi:hypothetical protein
MLFSPEDEMANDLTRPLLFFNMSIILDIWKLRALS